MTVAVALCALTAVAAAVAAAAEARRFALLLRGRTAVLGAGQVSASDAAVIAAGAAVLAAGLIAALTALGALARLAEAAAHRAGVRAPRTPEAIVARTLIPGWNLYGAGQVIVETFRLVHRSGAPGAPDDGRIPRRTVRLIAAWWACWIANGVIAALALALSFGSSNQAMADSVELHIVVDGVAAVTATLSAFVLAALRRAWVGRDPKRYRNWAVATPTARVEVSDAHSAEMPRAAAPDSATSGPADSRSVTPDMPATPDTAWSASGSTDVGLSGNQVDRERDEPVDGQTDDAAGGPTVDPSAHAHPDMPSAPDSEAARLRPTSADTRIHPGKHRRR